VVEEWLKKLVSIWIGALGEICPLGYLGGLIGCIFQIQVFQQDCFICQRVSKEWIQSDLIQLWTNRKCYVYETLFFKSTPLLPSPLLAAGTVTQKSCILSCVEIVNFINSCLFLVLLFKLHQNLHWGPRVPAAAIPLKHHLKGETFHSADCLPWGWGCGRQIWHDLPNCFEGAYSRKYFAMFAVHPSHRNVGFGNPNIYS
jgi:hypothetical protein